MKPITSEDIEAVKTSIARAENEICSPVDNAILDICRDILSLVERVSQRTR